MKNWLNGLGALALCQLLAAGCGDAGDDDADVSSTSQALNATVVEDMVMTKSPLNASKVKALHQRGFSGAYGSQLARPNNVYTFFGIEGTMWGSATNWIQFGQALYHNVRFSGGNWAHAENNWQPIPGAFTGGTYTDVGMTEVQNNIGSTDLYICGANRANITGPIVSLLVLQAGLTQGGWQQATLLAPNFQQVFAVDCSGTGSLLEIVFVNDRTTYYMKRDMSVANSSWTTPLALSNTAPALPTKIATASVNGVLHVLMIGSDDAIYHRARFLDGSWSEWVFFPNQGGGGGWKDIASANVGNQLQFVALGKSAGIPYSGGSTSAGWLPLTQIQTFRNDPAFSVGVAGGR